MRGVTDGPEGAPPPEHASNYPKIELHVHLEATVRPALLLELARVNRRRLPADTAEGLQAYYSGARDFSGFVRRWLTVSSCVRHHDDFRRVVVDYAAQVRRHGCVYAEVLCSVSEPVNRGTTWEEVFEGYCEGAAEARETHGVDVRLTPDITRDFPVEVGEELARRAIRYRDRGVVGVSLGGSERRFAAAPFARAFAIARQGGLGSVPHAGEFAGGAAGADSVRAALDVLRADRIRHGIRAVDDPGLLAELAARGIVCDVTPLSNVYTRAVASLHEHPLPAMLAAGVRCSISSDDPQIMGTDLSRDCAAAVGLGHSPRAMYEHALAGALCDEGTRARLRALGDAFAWGAAQGV